MGCSATKEQVRRREKTVTRRIGWWFLKPGDRVWLVEQAMGLKKGEHVVRLALVEVVRTSPEPLDYIRSYTREEIAAEGFAGFSAEEFIEMFVRLNSPRVNRRTVVNRIEFKYIDAHAEEALADIKRDRRCVHA
jgi:hypothetical protein